LLVENNPALARELGISGTFNTTSMAQSAASVAFQSMRAFSHYFGETPFKTVSVTQQPAGSFGQAWPSLIFLPYTAFLDGTVRHQLRLSESASHRQFYDEVGPHEIAHQWWGHVVGWKSYRDQWLSEGFAQFSAGLFTHLSQGPEKFDEFLNLERKSILEKTRFGYRPTDVGPITLGYRLVAKNTESAYQQVVYGKGGFVLHMLRMLMRDNQKNSDEQFINMMRDFVKTHYNRDASTEDFQAIVSKHFGQDMSWFLQQWVYGTEVPKITIRYQFAPGDAGKTLFKGDVAMTNVSPDFRVVMPFLLRFGKANGAGRINVTGASTPFQIELPQKPDGVEFNMLQAVLCDLDVSAASAR
jgi:aminopeptidase N